MQAILLLKRYNRLLKHGPLWMVLNANPYVNIYNLQVGDEICIPCRIRPREDCYFLTCKAIKSEV